MKKENTPYLLVASICLPFAIYFYGMRKRSLTILKFALPSFYGFLGYTLQLRGSSDAYRAVENFDSIANNYSFSFFAYAIEKITNFKSEGTEIYYDLVSAIVSLFSSNFRFFFMFNGIVAGILVYKIIKTITDLYPKISRISLVLISLIAPPMLMLNGRFWLASVYFILMALYYINSKQPKYILYSFFSVFIHQGLAIASIILILFYFLKDAKKIVFGIFLISLLYFGSGSQFVENLLTLFSDTIENQIQGYANIDVEEAKNTVLEARSQNFYIYSLKGTMLHYLILLCFIYFLFLDKLNDPFLNYMILLTILFFSFYNLTSTISSVGARYLRIGSMIGLIPVLIGFARIKQRYLKIGLIMCISFVYIIELRLESEQLFAFFPIFGIVQALIAIPDLTVMELIK